MAVGDEIKSLDRDATAGSLAVTVEEPEVEDHVSPEAENVTLASENPGAENGTGGRQVRTLLDNFRRLQMELVLLEVASNE